MRIDSVERLAAGVDLLEHDADGFLGGTRPKRYDGHTVTGQRTKKRETALC